MPFGGMRNRRESLALIGSAVLLSALPRRAASAATRRWNIAGDRFEKLDAIDAIMREFMEQRGIRAGAVAVARQGEVLFERAYTWAEPDYPVVGTASPFRVASVSKAFTEALIYTLVQAGAVKLDAAVFPYLGLEQVALPGQSVDPRLRTITVDQLLDHKGGWDRKAAGFDPCFKMRVIANKLGLRNAPTKRDIARFMVGEPLQFDPGSKESYSNFGYLMLGLVAEKAAGDTYGNALTQRVTAPLGIDGVFVAHTRKDMRLPGEGFYDQPGTGLTPEFPGQEGLGPSTVRRPRLADGGDGRGRRHGGDRRCGCALRRSLRHLGLRAAALRTLGTLRRHGRHEQLCRVAPRRHGFLRRRQHEQFSAERHERRGCQDRRRIRDDRILEPLRAKRPEP